MVSLGPERTEDLEGVGLRTLPRTELVGEDHGEETTSCKPTEDKRIYIGQDLSLPRTRPGVGTAGELSL